MHDLETERSFKPAMINGMMALGGRADQNDGSQRLRAGRGVCSGYEEKRRDPADGTQLMR